MSQIDSSPCIGASLCRLVPRAIAMGDASSRARASFWSGTTYLNLHGGGSILLGRVLRSAQICSGMVC